MCCSAGLRPVLSPHVDGLLEIKSSDILASHPHCVDQSIREPIRNRFSRRLLLHTNVIGQSTEALDHLAELNNLWTVGVRLAHPRRGLGIDFRVGPLAYGPHFTDLHRLVLGDAVDDAPGVTTDYKLPETGQFSTKRVAGLGILQQEKDLLQHLGHRVWTDASEVIDRWRREDNV